MLSGIESFWIQLSQIDKRRRAIEYNISKTTHTVLVFGLLGSHGCFDFL